jgi:flagellar hook-associated protein 1 FlgK
MMTISAALNSALSGLAANSRASSIVSENLANALTPGYARRTLELASDATTGPGVRVIAVNRHSDPAVIANRRTADAAFGMSQTLASFHKGFESLVGIPTDPASMGMRLADFESSLITAASRPDSGQRLESAAMAAKDLAQSVSHASDGLRAMREQADAKIGLEVSRLNQALENVQKLNAQITSIQSSGGNTAALLDQRQLLVDEVNTMIPVREVSRDHGQIALYTSGGLALLDGSAATLDYQVTNTIMPHMTVQNGLLSGLEVNGVLVRTDSANKQTGGGTLASHFQIRDELSVAAQAELDSVARDLIQRFETPTLDATVASGQPGLFTDSGAPFDPASETGLAGRLELNALVDPAVGAESWRLRAGLGAALPGPVGDARQLQAFVEVLSRPMPSFSASHGTRLFTAADSSANLLANAGRSSHDAERTLSFSSASQTEMARIEAEQGVDSDFELQTLMMIEQAFAANARIVEAADEMMKTLLRL